MDKLQVTLEDRSKAVECVTDLKAKLASTVAHVNKQIKKVKRGEWNTSKGLSFLEVKYQLLLSYLVNLTHLMYVKSSGKTISGNTSIHHLVEIRTVLEKMRPIDQKLKYQVDKLIKTAATGSVAENDPLRFKPNPDNLVSKLEESSEEENSDEEKKNSSKVYKISKIAPMHYDGDTTHEELETRRTKRELKRAHSSSVMRDLRAEYHDGPEEIRDTADMHRAREDHAGKDREEYEEKYLVRTAVSKKEKTASHRLRTMVGLDDLTRFGDFSALTEERGGENEFGGPKKRKKQQSKGKGKKKGFKKKRHF